MIQSNINQIISQFGVLGGLYAHSPSVAAEREKKAEIKTTKKELDATEQLSKELEQRGEDLPTPPSTSVSPTQFNLESLVKAPEHEQFNKEWAELSKRQYELKEKLAKLDPSHKNMFAAFQAKEEARVAGLTAEEDVIQKWADRYQEANKRMAAKGEQKIVQKENFNKTKEFIKSREPSEYNKLKLKNELLKRELNRKETD